MTRPSTFLFRASFISGSFVSHLSVHILILIFVHFHNRSHNIINNYAMNIKNSWKSKIGIWRNGQYPIMAPPLSRSLNQHHPSHSLITFMLDAISQYLVPECGSIFLYKLLGREVLLFHICIRLADSLNSAFSN